MSKIIAYEYNGNVVITRFSSTDVATNVNYIELSELPVVPNECLYIENNELKIDQQKLIEFNRQKMPTLSPIEFDLKLNNAGLYDAVQELIKDNFELRIAYTRAIFFSRLNPFIIQATEALGLTPEQVDEIWTA